MLMCTFKQSLVSVHIPPYSEEIPYSNADTVRDGGQNLKYLFHTKMHSKVQLKPNEASAVSVSQIKWISSEVKVFLMQCF